MIKLNIKMNDGTFLNEIMLFKSKDLGDSVIRTKGVAKAFLNFHCDKTIYYSGKYTQGWLIPNQISDYEIIEDTEEVKIKLSQFIKANSGIWDLEDASEFIMYYREELLGILK